ncbi:McrC family protein [Dyadobacter chenhuakuii]|uniref:McrC family protein n=1 Tax=Dyadobacter chenhuakuii TaxID=2909339 RepID=A0ABY4XMT7_9BACT|nr:McrC family protein [Dyadobacter chenhuakuii]MCF2494273.1 McrC family protein [Dyadobacter chenhuakuii]USJ31398.1 McrC family protein [Dyadobacter chenhuakuii]
MNRDTIIQVFEHDKLRVIANESSTFTQQHLTALTRYYEKQPQPYFKLIHQGVQFSQYVGVIRVGSLTIEILPKIGKVSDGNLWQQVLIGMLIESRLLDVRSPTQASLRVKPHSILELYIAVFLDEVELLQHQGLLKAYRRMQENKGACKGRLVVHRQITQNYAHQERFYVDHPTYDNDNLLNQLLYKTLRLIPLLTYQPLLVGRTRTLLLNFPQQADILTSSDLFNELVYNRKTSVYQPAIQLCELLLLNYHPDLMAGRKPVLALLFDMNKVWEQYVWQRIRKSALFDAYNISCQNTKPFWGNHSIKPDIYLEKKEVMDEEWPNIIVDTKWKVNTQLVPSGDDLKQMFTYNHHYRASRSLLIYPAAEPNQDTISRPFKLAGTCGIHYCQLCALPVLSEVGLNKNIATNIWALIYNSGPYIHV